jgi:hypothetical protein
MLRFHGFLARLKSYSCIGAYVELLQARTIENIVGGLRSGFQPGLDCR